MTCDDALVALVLRDDDPAARAHVASCPACTADGPAAIAVRAALAAHPVAEPAVGRTDAILRAAAPLLAINAERARRRRTTIAQAIAASLLPLPLLVLLNLEMLRTIHGWLVAVVPSALGTYLIGSWTALLVVLFTLTYAAVPLLAGHQARYTEEAHA